MKTRARILSVILAPEFWTCVNWLLSMRIVGGGSTTMWLLARVFHR